MAAISAANLSGKKESGIHFNQVLTVTFKKDLTDLRNDTELLNLLRY